MNIASAGMAGMVGAAAKAQFAIDKATGDKLIADLETMQEQVAEALGKAARLERPVQLGQLPEAHAVSQLNLTVAAGSPQSMLAVLKQFEVSLGQAHEAVKQGMANYEQVEADTRRTFQQGMREEEERRRSSGGGWIAV